MTPTELLTRFVARHDIRAYINDIIDQGDYYYAADGYCIVRIPKCAGVTAFETTVNCALGAVFDSCHKGNQLPLPTITPSALLKCSPCNGSGQCYRCPDCDGRGEFEHGNHTYECYECEGTGQVEEKGVFENDEPQQCAQCDGTGLVGEQSVEVYDSKFAFRNFHKIIDLPHIRIATNKNEPAYFTFDGGEGVMLTMRM